MAARKFASVKFADVFVEEARREAELFNRSVAGQIEHWARLGRALEGAPGMPVGRVREALEGKVKLRTLPLAEQEAVLDRMHDWLKNPTADEAAAYADLADLPDPIGVERKAKVAGGPPRLRKIV